MKVIIAGTREGAQWAQLTNAIENSRTYISEIVCGGALGVDTMGERWAQEHNIPIKYFYAQWNRYRKSAGTKRNIEMGDYADALIALPSKSQSKGTYHMISYMKKLNKPVYVYELP